MRMSHMPLIFKMVLFMAPAAYFVAMHKPELAQLILLCGVLLSI